MTLEERIKAEIRDVPDFPKPGIVFKDISPILKNASLSREITKLYAEKLKDKNIDAIAGVESRGFLFGMALAMEMDLPFILIRKKGKLPYKTVSYKYDLEYGSAEIEMHTDAVSEGMNVLIHDDLLATGGTAAATAELLKMKKANVAGFAFIVDLSFLNGSEILKQYSENIINLVVY